MNPNLKVKTLDDGSIVLRTLNAKKMQDIINALDTMEFRYTMQACNASSAYDNYSRISVTREYVFVIDSKQSNV